MKSEIEKAKLGDLIKIENKLESTNLELNFAKLEIKAKTLELEKANLEIESSKLEIKAKTLELEKANLEIESSKSEIEKAKLGDLIKIEKELEFTIAS
jgi:hypothetical protein